MSVSELLSPLVGRLIFGWFFLVQVFVYAGDWENTITVLSFAGVPGAAFVLALTLLLMTMGALSLIFGYHARYGALVLFTVTIVATAAIHDYWRHADPAERAAEFRLFAGNAAIAGGLLMLIGLGAGPMAIDNRNKGGAGPRKK